MRSGLRVVLGVVLALGALALPRVVAARPLYFDNLVSIYGLTPADDIHACGVCHRLWTGTGARNPFGSAVEGQLYLGKPIAQAIVDVAGFDTDGDGFTNGDELGIYRTLPGYSCDNFFLATNPPANFQSLITPGVPSCLAPKDIRIDPTNVGFATQAGQQGVEIVDVFNNGADDPITVSSYGFLAGASATLGVTGPALPIVIPVGGSVQLQVTFTPPAVVLANGTLRISSDDPDEADIDVPVSGISFANPLAPAAERAACLRDVSRQMERYTKTHLKEWGTCFAAELAGVACDAGRRDLKVGQAEAKLRGVLGGATDRFCTPTGLTPARLGLPATCGGGCGAIELHTLSDIADCLVYLKGQVEAKRQFKVGGVVGAEAECSRQPQQFGFDGLEIELNGKSRQAPQKRFPIDLADASAPLVDENDIPDFQPKQAGRTGGLVAQPLESLAGLGMILVAERPAGGH